MLRSRFARAAMRRGGNAVSSALVNDTAAFGGGGGGGVPMVGSMRFLRGDEVQAGKKAATPKKRGAQSAAPTKKRPPTLIQQLITKVDALGTRFDAVETKIDDLKKEFKLDVAGLKVRIDPSNHGKVSKAKRSVIKPEFGTHAGGDATWTLVKWGKRYFAIGAAHCALYYDAATDEGEVYTPVFLPSEFAPFASKVYVSPKVDGDALYRDIVMVELESSPKGMRGVPVTFTKLFVPEKHKLVSTFAATSAFDLLGSAPERVKYPGEMSANCFFFHVKQHEPGNSGALLWAMGDKNTAVPYGVFYGVDDVALREDMLLRGVGVPLPRADGSGDFVLSNGEPMTCYDVASFEKTTVKFRKFETKKVEYEEMNEEGKMEKKEKWVTKKELTEAVVEKAPGEVPKIEGYPCVFVKGTFAMNGAGVCKALGCGRVK